MSIGAKLSLRPGSELGLSKFYTPKIFAVQKHKVMTCALINVGLNFEILDEVQSLDVDEAAN